MKLFVYWPLALNPGAKRALVVSYGLGNTAEALVQAPGIEQVDVVDLSRTILGLSALVDRADVADPLADLRVHVRVEDGRFFLHVVSAPYDLIAAEPPPPHAAGVASLYSREYFELTRRRLAPGGIATHWLPVNQLPLEGARAVVRAFCRISGLQSVVGGRLRLDPGGQQRRADAVGGRRGAALGPSADRGRSA